MNAAGGDFDFADTLEGKQELDEIRWRVFTGLSHDVADSVRDRGVKQHSLNLHAGKVDPDGLAFLKHRTILRPKTENCNATSASVYPLPFH